MKNIFYIIHFVIISSFSISGHGSIINNASKQSVCGIENAEKLLRLKNEVINSVSTKFSYEIGADLESLQPDLLLPRICKWFNPGVGIEVNYRAYKNKYKYVLINKIPNNVLIEMVSNLIDEHHPIAVFSKSFWRELVKLQSKDIKVGFLSNLNSSGSLSTNDIGGLTVFEENLILSKIMYGEQIIKHEGRHWDQISVVVNDEFHILSAKQERKGSNITNNCLRKLYRSSQEIDALIAESNEFESLINSAQSIMNILNIKNDEINSEFLKMDRSYFNMHLRYLNDKVKEILNTDCNKDIKQWYTNLRIMIENKYNNEILNGLYTSKNNYYLPFYHYFSDISYCNKLAKEGSPRPKKCNQDFNLLRNKNMKLLEENIPLEKQYIKNAGLFMEELSTSDPESLNNPMVIEAISYTENLMLFVGGD